MTARQVIFSGKVQGVGFRYHTKELALGFEVVGWVKNLRDGTVELQVMGQEAEVDEFLSEIIEESELAPLIRNHLVTEIELLEGCKEFRIAN